MAQLLYAQPGIGPSPSAGGIGWVDFGNGFTINPGETKTDISAVLLDGSTVTFDLSSVAVEGLPGEPFEGVAAPAWPQGAAFGNTGYTWGPLAPAGNGTPSPGNIVLYTAYSTVIEATATQITVGNIRVADKNGNPIVNYQTFIADGESTNLSAQESITVTTDTGVWNEWTLLPGVIVAGLAPTLTGTGTATATIAAVGGGHAPAYVLETFAPKNIEVILRTTARQGFAIGFAITKVSVEKDVEGRLKSADQFDLIITGIPSDTATTTGNTNGIQNETANVFAIPDNQYTVDEAMAVTSISPLSYYTTTVSAVNLAAGGTTPPQGNLPINVTPQVGDVIIYTIKNTALDFGDAPDTGVQGNGSYRTLLASDGPRHIASPNLTLGVTRTAEPDGYQNPTATGDDLVLGVPDDATSLPLTDMLDDALSYKFTLAVYNVTGTPANLYVWIDFNQDGIFETEEGISLVVPSALGIQSIDVEVPVAYALPIPTGQTFVRVRLTTEELVNKGGLTEEDTRSYGLARDGEVEDYELIVNADEDNPKLVIVKSADRTDVVLGDIVTYEIEATNVLTVGVQEIPLDNVKISDILPSELEFVPGSVTINGASDAAANIIAGIDIGPLAVGETKFITFKAKVISDAVTPITNIVTGDYQYMFPQAKVNYGVAQSNPYSLSVYKADVTINKIADVTEVGLGDTIKYTVTIMNRGDLTAYNVLFQDQLPAQVQLVPGSFKVNDKAWNGVDLIKGITIPSILPKQTVIITYEVLVVAANCSGLIVNEATAAYDYRLPDGTTGTVSATSQQNSVVVVITINTFKQMSIESQLTIPEVKPDIEVINTVTGTVTVTSCHVIETVVAHSEEGQTLTGYKLIVRGNLEISIEYTALEAEQSLHSAHYTLPFSTFIILPSYYTVGSKFEVAGLVEDIYYSALDTRDFFVNITTLVNAKILGC